MSRGIGSDQRGHVGQDQTDALAGLDVDPQGSSGELEWLTRLFGQHRGHEQERSVRFA